MARYSEIVVLKEDKDKRLVLKEIDEYLRSEKFYFMTYRGEKVYKKGTGMVGGPQFIKLEIVDDKSIKLSGWVKYPILPGLYIGEISGQGVTSNITRQNLENRLDRIKKILTEEYSR